MGSCQGTSKRRKLDPTSKLLAETTMIRPNVVHTVVHPDDNGSSFIAPDKEHARLRLQLVDSVAKAMQLDFHNLPVPESEPNGQHK